MVLHVFASLILVLGLHPVVLDTEFLQAAIHVESKPTRFVTGDNFVREPLLLDNE